MTENTKGNHYCCSHALPTSPGQPAKTNTLGCPLSGIRVGQIMSLVWGILCALGYLNLCVPDLPGLSSVMTYNPITDASLSLVLALTGLFACPLILEGVRKCALTSSKTGSQCTLYEDKNKTT